MKTTNADARAEKTAYMLFGELSRIVMKRFRADRDSMGMKEGYRHIMYHLSHGDDGAAQQVIVSHTHLSAPTVSVSLGRMEREGIVRRVTDENDQRSVHVFLTEKGWEMERARRKSMCDVEREFYSNITEEEQEQLRAILKKIRDGFAGV
ncbi:MAG: MarR family winged helix-turn-helix transcriptional regulator [Eubacteriales bacterium]|nr:MarR family transcriptional regulator [Clostridiales bacterium]